MGMIDRLLGLPLGRGANVLRETIEVFRENTEAGALRDHEGRAAALEQFAAEFTPRRTAFDSVIDGLNRLPRPLLALGTIGLFVSAMVSPAWFATRMEALAAVPEALWWLMGAVISFYFGARHQWQGQAFQRDLAASALRLGLQARDASGEDAPGKDAAPNPALEAWRHQRR
ncbi:holin family protein [Pseudooceanicola sp. 502str34]